MAPTVGPVTAPFLPESWGSACTSLDLTVLTHPQQALPGGRKDQLDFHKLYLRKGQPLGHAGGGRPGRAPGCGLPGLLPAQPGGGGGGNQAWGQPPAPRRPGNPDPEAPLGAWGGGHAPARLSGPLSGESLNPEIRGGSGFKRMGPIQERGGPFSLPPRISGTKAQWRNPSEAGPRAGKAEAAGGRLLRPPRQLPVPTWHPPGRGRQRPPRPHSEARRPGRAAPGRQGGEATLPCLGSPTAQPGPRRRAGHRRGGGDGRRAGAGSGQRPAGWACGGAFRSSASVPLESTLDRPE